EHNQLARGITLQRDGRTVRISATVPVELPSGLLEEVFPEPTIGGERLYHPEGYWVGAALSSFGIVYNRDVLAMLKLPQPTTWADLADPRYARWIGLADPGHSGSIAAAYNVILRRLGWNEGWRLLRRIFANARYFTSSASKVPVDVSAGEAAAGMCIDFYGRFQAGAIAAGGESRVGYVDPPFLTTTTADPISVIRGAPHRELANHFVAWLLSRPAQGLWQRRVGTPEGPRRFELRRLPARRDLYTPEEKQFWSDPEVDPFGASRPIPPAMPDFYGMVAPVAHALGIDVHDDLTAAWRAIQRTPEDHPRRRAMLELFDRMPPELELTWPDDLEQHWQDALADEDHRDHEQVVQTLRAFHERLIQRYAGSAGEDRLLEDRLAWTRFFQANYRRVVDLAE
ncbi:MAG TPA: extracellular solute-binding protein, partial [Phycisphaeraceae bacterium]